MATDLDEGGPTADIRLDHLAAIRRDAIQLRLLDGLFRLVLCGEEPQLAPVWP